MDFAPQVWAKCDAELRRALEKLPASSPEELSVLVVLAPSSEPGSPPPGADRTIRARWARRCEELFATRAAPLITALEAAGGHKLRLYWIGNAIAGTLPATAIAAAGREPEVARLELIVQHNVLL